MKREKINKDKYYSLLYKDTRNLDLLVRAGYWEDSLTEEEEQDKAYYKLNLLTTPTDKLSRNIKTPRRPIVLLSTGGFYPIHEGHLHMMTSAKQVLEQQGYDVIGGYFSLSHDEYIGTKPYPILNQHERLAASQRQVAESDWLMIDPWESLYVRTSVNFTAVIDRLTQYLKRYVANDIQVAYVFGGDNVEFMHCFKNTPDTIGVCVKRTHTALFEQTKALLHLPNMYYIEGNATTKELSSRNIRKAYTCQQNHTPKGRYVLRNEGILPLKDTFGGLIAEGTLVQAQSYFLTHFKALLESYLPQTLKVEVTSLETQLHKARHELGNTQTISLDTYFKGNYNLEVSRLFEISSLQDRYVDLVGRLGNQPVTEQLKSIPKGSYTLVDDDSVTGKTIQSVLAQLPEGIQINQYYFLANNDHNDLYDVIDLRDFIVGVANGGLVVRLPHLEITRAPYIAPYVNLTTRASIPTSQQLLFSKALWKLNGDFYRLLGSKLHLGEMSSEFKTLMHTIGFEDTDLIVDICKWHYSVL